MAALARSVLAASMFEEDLSDQFGVGSLAGIHGVLLSLVLSSQSICQRWRYKLIRQLLLCRS